MASPSALAKMSYAELTELELRIAGFDLRELMDGVAATKGRKASKTNS